MVELTYEAGPIDDTVRVSDVEHCASGLSGIPRVGASDSEGSVGDVQLIDPSDELKSASSTFCAHLRNCGVDGATDSGVVRAVIADSLIC